MIDEAKDTKDVDDTVNTRAHRPKLLTSILLIALLCATGYLLLRRGAGSGSAILSPQNAASVYQTILKETHTGIRLARLEDYIDQYPLSKNIASAKVQRGALKTNEDAAWAVLSSAYYGLENDEAAKSTALKNYLQNWGHVVRGELLEKLTGNGYDIEYPSRKLTDERSRFERKTASDNMLVGGPANEPTRRIYAPVTTAPHKTTVSPSVKARIKFATKPKYPSKAFRKKIPATVVLSFNIDERGSVSQVRVVSVSARRYEKKFIKAARRAAKYSRFYPQTINGTPVPTSGYERTYRFVPET